MDDHDSPLFASYINRVPLLAGIIVLAVGIVVIVGWAFNIVLFKSIAPNLVTVKPNTAVAFLFSSLSLILFNNWKNRFLRMLGRRLIPILSIGVIIIGLLTTLEYLFQRNLGIDQLFFREAANAVDTFVPGRMSPLTAGILIFIGSAHLLALRLRYWSSQFLSLIIILFAISVFSGYIFKVEDLYGPGPYTSVALLSALAIFFIGLGTISIFPPKSIIRTVYRNNVGGLVARRFLPAALIIPLIIGFIILTGEQMGFYGAKITILLSTMATIITFTFFIFINARLLSLIDEGRRESDRLRKQDAEAAQQRLNFLAKASRILSRSLDLDVTFKSIVRLSVPFLSDWCAIYLVQDNGKIARVAVKYTDNANDEIMAALEKKYPTDPVTSEGVYEVVATGQSKMIPYIHDEQFRNSAQNEEHLQLIRGLGLRSVIIAPLKGHETIFGAITFATAESKRHFTPVDQELAEEMGRRAAVAIENASLYQEKISQNELLERRVRNRTKELEVTNLELRTEIVERKRVETELRDSRETLASLVRTASRLITLRTLEQVSEIICRETADVLNVPICTSKLFNEQEKRWIYTYGHGLPASYGKNFNFVEEPLEVMSDGEESRPYRIISDVQALTDSPNFTLYQTHNMRTVVDIDMAIEKRLIGRLTIASVGESREFSENELLLLKGLADQAALAIQNARLLEQVQRAQKRLRTLTRQLVTAQEGERRRISAELHDEAGQSLTVMKINLTLLIDRLPETEPEIRGQLQDLADLAEDTLQRLRMLAYNLRPPSLEKLGLNKTLAGLCSQFSERTNIAIEYEGSEIEAIQDEATITIYRLVQEALTNVAKHADASQIRVKLARKDHKITLSIQDNGQGFDTGQLALYKDSVEGMGLGGMMERLEFIGGELEVSSKRGEGTTIFASIPLRSTQMKYE